MLNVTASDDSREQENNPAYYSQSSDSLLNFLFQAMSEKVPAVPKNLGARREWRDDCLIGLAKLKKQMKSN